MRALMIETEGRTRFHARDVPELPPDHVRVDVRHVGLCGTDLNTFKGLNPLVTLPRIPGHEIGGVVAEAGAGTALAPGQRVIVMPYTSCGHCTSCRQGRVNACRTNRTLGVQQDGGLAEQIVLPEGKLIPNDTLPPRHLALVEPLSVGFHAVARGRVGPGDRVVVIGCGMIGMGCIIGAAARGAEVIAIDVTAEKVALARRFGARHGCLAAEAAPEVERLTGGDGADVVIEAVGTPGTFTLAVDLAAFAGRVVYVGYSKAPVTYQTQLFNLKELDIMGSRNATLADFHSVIAHLEAAEGADALITRIVPFDEAEGALPYWDAHRDSVLKLVIER